MAEGPSTGPFVIAQDGVRANGVLTRLLAEGEGIGVAVVGGRRAPL